MAGRFILHCCISGLGIGLIPDALLPDPGLGPDALVPVLPDVVGQERPVRLGVPAMLSEILRGDAAAVRRAPARAPRLFRQHLARQSRGGESVAARRKEVQNPLRRARLASTQA
ncbi:hypothetical protein [Sorangium sp. So ce1182]|uniref:hypothetical protein n=1 Tax=Sorangium sp. So ce1182 TaxID=3133334 RepID=UPI003F645EAA